MFTRSCRDINFDISIIFNILLFSLLVISIFSYLFVIILYNLNFYQYYISNIMLLHFSVVRICFQFKCKLLWN